MFSRSRSFHVQLQHSENKDYDPHCYSQATPLATSFSFSVIATATVIGAAVGKVNLSQPVFILRNRETISYRNPH